MAVAYKSTIAFSLLSIPISMYTATQDNDLHFNQLHKEDNSRVRYKKTCLHCGKELKSEDIVKGYEYDKDKYVIITDDDIEKIKTKKDRTIQILHFAQLNQISPTYFNKTYYAAPELGSDRAFELLRASMMDEQKIAIGKTVLGDKETLLAIIPREDGILIQTMFYADDIKELPKAYNKPEVSAQELESAKTLISTMNTPFDPAKYNDEFESKKQDLVKIKVEQKEIVVAEPESETESKDNVIDIMDRLKMAIEAEQKNKEVDKPKRTRKKA
ncbi:Ku protein [Hydrogenoanaerobacterium sp.]|uniref:non-homologous end joining protein Ku n=1 Tax=Hydrogenoanaerobacterium sp. TaxID=2953763 RepID=UPI00289F292C|nr:Ku protein [Hydrogenoanaerobacterium sp.]